MEKPFLRENHTAGKKLCKWCFNYVTPIKLRNSGIISQNAIVFELPQLQTVIKSQNPSLHLYHPNQSHCLFSKPPTHTPTLRSRLQLPLSVYHRAPVPRSHSFWNKSSRANGGQLVQPTSGCHCVKVVGTERLRNGTEEKNVGARKRRRNHAACIHCQPKVWNHHVFHKTQ